LITNLAGVAVLSAVRELEGMETVMTWKASIAAVLLALGTSATAGAQGATLSGTVTYRERIALPPTAVIEVWLEDVSRADAPGAIVGSVRITRPGQVPLKFAMTYDPADVSPARRYAVRARIVDGKTILFATTDTTLVLTQGHGASPNLVLQMVKQPAAASPAPPPAPPLPANPLTGLPATFTGTLPCADCQGVRYHLNLFADDSFFLRRTYVGKTGGPADEIGSWALSSDRRVLVLRSSRDSSDWFSVSAPGTLRLLDAAGNPIDSKAPAELKRSPVFTPAEVQLPMRGAYMYMADAGVFVECATGQRWPVAMEVANRDLETGYLKARPAPATPVLVEVEGRVTAPAAARGEMPPRALVVTKVVRWLPKEQCAPRFVSAPLGDTVWRLTQLAGKDIPASRDSRRDQSLIFDEASQTFSGSTGCNRLIGQYTIDQAAISLSAGGTLMACRNEAQTEAALMAALKATRTYRITGRVLELMDAKGVRLARFEAREPTGITRSR
jgi:copper homeostasis protein (lipoprotein)